MASGLKNPKFMTVPFEKLDFNPEYNYREASSYKKDNPSIVKMMKDLENQGLKTRLEVVETEDGSLKGLRGFRRYHGIKFLRESKPEMFNTVDVIVYKGLTALEIETHRADHGLVVGLNRVEQYLAAIRLSIAGATENAIGEAFGQSRGWAMTRVHIYKMGILVPEIEAVYLGKEGAPEIPLPNKVIDGAGDIPGLFKTYTEFQDSPDEVRKAKLLEAWETYKAEVKEKGSAPKSRALSTEKIKDLKDKVKSQSFRFILGVVLGLNDQGEVQKWDDALCLMEANREKVKLEEPAAV